MRKNIIAVDIDDTVANLVPSWLRLYELRSKHKLSKEDITDWDLSKFVLPEFKKEIYTYIERPSIYNNVKPMTGALWGYNKLKQMGFDIIFVTHSPLGCAGRKYEWLIENGFEVDHKNYIECYRKDLLNVDWMVDDKYENVRDTSGIGILMTNPWNKKYDWNLRANNWEDVINIIEGKFES